MASISYLAHFGPHGWLLRQTVRSMILVEAAELRTSRIITLRSAVLSPLIHSLFKSTRLAQKASRVDSCRGGEI